MLLYVIITIILLGLALMDYISYKKGGLLYITGDSLAFNRVLIDVKIKITSISRVDIIIDEGANTAYYLITVHNGAEFKTVKTEPGSDRYNHAGKLLIKCGIREFNTIYK